MLYADEITPGNPLKANNMRKLWGVYFSVVEFGSSCLSSEYGWHTLLCLRSHSVKEMSLTTIVHYLLQVFSRFEMGITLPGVSDLVCSKVKFIIADEAALKSIYEFKGASGLLPCPLCSNVVLKSSELHLINPALKAHTTPSLEGLVQHDDVSVQAIMGRLRSQKDVLNKTRFAELEKALGFNFVADGVLASADLGITTLHFDWAHCILIQGTFQVEESWQELVANHNGLHCAGKSIGLLDVTHGSIYMHDFHGRHGFLCQYSYTPFLLGVKSKMFLCGSFSPELSCWEFLASAFLFGVKSKRFLLLAVSRKSLIGR